MILNFFKELGEAKQKIVDAENRLAEERLAVVEERRQLEEEKQKFAIERAEKAGFLIRQAKRKVKEKNILKFTLMKNVFSISNLLFQFSCFHEISISHFASRLRDFPANCAKRNFESYHKRSRDSLSLIGHLPLNGAS